MRSLNKTHGIKEITRISTLTFIYSNIYDMLSGFLLIINNHCAYFRMSECVITLITTGLIIFYKMCGKCVLSKFAILVFGLYNKVKLYCVA